MAWLSHLNNWLMGCDSPRCLSTLITLSKPVVDIPEWNWRRVLTGYSQVKYRRSNHRNVDFPRMGYYIRNQSRGKAAARIWVWSATGMTGSQLLLLWKNDLWAQRLKSFLFGPIRVKRGCYIHYLLYGKWGLLKRSVVLFWTAN